MARRRIIKREYYRHPSCPRYARGSVIVTLECGCEKGYKFSKDPRGNWVLCNCKWEKPSEERRAVQKT